MPISTAEAVAQIPILRLDGVLLVTMQEDLTDSDADGLPMLVGDQVVRYAARGLLLDLTAVSTVDSYMGRALVSVARAAALLGADTVLTGVRPAVAITIVELGMDFAGLGAASSVQAGLEVLRTRIGSPR